MSEELKPWRVQLVAKDHALIWEGEAWIATIRSQEWAKKLVEEHNAKVPHEQ